MATETHIRNGGVWRQIVTDKDLYTYSGGVWRTNEFVYVRNGGSWRTVYDRVVSVGVGGVGVTCFLPWQKVLMADGTLKPISEVKVGALVRGRWGINQVRGTETPRLGNRSMWLINGMCLNTPDHPQWTLDGWSVIDTDFYAANDFGCECVLYGEDGDWWIEKYQPCDPNLINSMEVGKTQLAIPGRLKWMPLTSLQEVTKYHPEQVLHSLALTGDATMYVDGFCFSGWANKDTFDYAERVGT